MFSNRVSRILERRAEKASRHEVKIVDIERGLYEVIAKNERRTRHGQQDRVYDVVVRDDLLPICKCRKPQNTGIACSHILAVCANRNFDSNAFTRQDYYGVITLMCTWEGRFEVFGREEDWPPYHGPKIIPDRNLIKKGRRKNKRYEMTMDVLEGRVGPKYCEICGTINHTTSQHPRQNQAGSSARRNSDSGPCTSQHLHPTQQAGLSKF